MRIFALIIIALASSYASAETIAQCAVDNVIPHGARVNIIQKDGKLRANLIFGTTVSGTMYNVEKTYDGYAGEVKSKPELNLTLAITSLESENSNVRGYVSHLKVVYPTLENESGYGVIETDLICGEKIATQWK